MTDKTVVLVTVGSAREGKRIAKSLLEKHLIACANLIPLIQSIYRWDGKIKQEKECLLILKSSRERFADLAHEVRLLHSYAVPEVIALPIIDGSPNYLNWMTEELPAAENVPAAG